MSEISAYQKMLKDGTAFKKIDMNKIQNQQYAQASIGAGNEENSMPLGEPAPIMENSNLEEDNTDWSAVDNAMQKRINSLRSKMDSVTKTQIIRESEEIVKLKKRIEKLEEAMILIMETHEKMIG